MLDGRTKKGWKREKGGGGGGGGGEGKKSERVGREKKGMEEKEKKLAQLGIRPLPFYWKGRKKNGGKKKEIKTLTFHWKIRKKGKKKKEKYM